MSQTRYREARTLVRRLCRLPGEDRNEFKRKLAWLREHFQRFNVDVSELCQWLMGLRRQYLNSDKPESFGVVGDFILEPNLDGVEADEKERDRWRLDIFDMVAGFGWAETVGGHAPPAQLREAMLEVAQLKKTPTTERLFARLGVLERSHRLVLLKSAAEWVVARYQRGMKNWQRQQAEWLKEKTKWEEQHPELTEAVREQFGKVIETLKDPDDPTLMVRRKNPRICPHERLRQNKDNCIYAGEKGHGPLCWKYVEFVKQQKARKSKEGRFWERANKYVEARRRGTSHQRALDSLFRNERNPHRAKDLRQVFEDTWRAYLEAMNLTEATAIQHGRLPHCRKIRGTWEKSECEWNPHTELCRQYKEKLAGLNEATLKLEPLYREWRRYYFSGPRKPVFRYPSNRDLPMPKVFGTGFYEIDFEPSVLRLRLDNMREGEWMESGFIAWPRGYNPSKAEVQVTSVHVNFVGSRARAGFRFDVPRRESRFGCAQDEIDELRSRQFPRQAQDQGFLDAARQRLLESFVGGEGERELRVLAVDLGEKGAEASVYRGREHVEDIPLRIVKINKSYDELPRKLEKDPKDRKLRGPLELGKEDPRGVRKEHVGRHLERLGKGASEVAAHRQPAVSQTVTIGDHDFRGLKRHVAWMIRDWVRHNASQIVKAAEERGCELIVFESMRGSKPPGYDKLGMESERQKRWMAMFAYGRIRRKVAEKAVERGMRVVTVPYFKSSQFCSACGHEQLNKKRWGENKKKRRKFICECGQPQGRSGTAPRCSCKLELNSDANAARVLARVFWGEIKLPSPDRR